MSAITLCITPVILVSFLLTWLFPGHILVLITHSNNTAQISATFEVI